MMENNHTKVPMSPDQIEEAIMTHIDDTDCDAVLLWLENTRQAKQALNPGNALAARGVEMRVIMQAMSHHEEELGVLNMLINQRKAELGLQ